MARKKVPLAVSLNKVAQLQGRAPSHLQEAVRCGKLLKIGNFAQVLQVMLLLLQWDHMSLADFAIFFLADICISRYCPERVSTCDLANPCVQYAGRAFTFQDAYKGTHIHSVFKKHDAITGHGHRIIELFHGVEDVLCRTILLLLAFLRSSELAAFICDKVETTPVDKYDLMSWSAEFKKTKAGCTARRFLPPRPLRRITRDGVPVKLKYQYQKLNYDLQRYTLADILGAAGANGRHLMFPHIVGFFKEWHMWKDCAASPSCKVTQNTRIFQAVVKKKEPLLLETFQTHIKQAQGISETHREDLLAMDALTLRAMQCKLVCTVANFRGRKEPRAGQPRARAVEQPSCHCDREAAGLVVWHFPSELFIPGATLVQTSSGVPPSPPSCQRPPGFTPLQSRLADGPRSGRRRCS
eukprot:s4513_g7.t1